MSAQPSLTSVMDDLRSKATEKTRAIYVRHGNPPDRTLGVSIADLKLVAKTIKKRQDLACELYATRVLEAMYLAGLVANGGQMTPEELLDWAEGAADMDMVASYSVPWVAAENPEAWNIANLWIDSSDDAISASGWRLLSGLITTRPDEDLDLDAIKSLLDRTIAQIHGSGNRSKSAMNGFVISVGIYVRPLILNAKAAAAAIGEVSVDVGDTDCKTPLAADYIAKAENMGKVGKKRKSMRC